ncbi:MAG: hypothetical protein ACXVBI_10545 [Flavisolibacter sp.]
MTSTRTKGQLLIGITALFVSCTLSMTKRKDPVFTNTGKVQKELTSMVRAEHFNLAGKEITSTGKTTAEIEVAIINAINVPTSDNERKALEKSIAASVKSNLKDPNSYDKYTVLFVTKETSGAVTKRNWVGDVFSVKEL